MKFSIKDFFSKCDQIRSFLVVNRICKEKLQIPKKLCHCFSENFSFVFYVVNDDSIV